MGEGEVRFRIQVIPAIAFGSSSLRKPKVDRDSAPTAEPVEDPVEDAPSVLVFIEAERLEIVNIARRLRGRELVCVLHVPRQRIGVADIVGDRVPQERGEIARRR